MSLNAIEAGAGELRSLARYFEERIEYWREVLGVVKDRGPVAPAGAVPCATLERMRGVAESLNTGREEIRTAIDDMDSLLARLVGVESVPKTNEASTDSWYPVKRAEPVHGKVPHERHSVR